MRMEAGSAGPVGLRRAVCYWGLVTHGGVGVGEALNAAAATQQRDSSELVWTGRAEGRNQGGGRREGEREWITVSGTGPGRMTCVHICMQLSGVCVGRKSCEG
jgi:hypothetical protein